MSKVLHKTSRLVSTLPSATLMDEYWYEQKGGDSHD